MAGRGSDSCGLHDRGSFPAREVPGARVAFVALAAGAELQLSQGGDGVVGAKVFEGVDDGREGIVVDAGQAACSWFSLTAIAWRVSGAISAPLGQTTVQPSSAKFRK